MTLHITVLPASTRPGAEAIRALLASQADIQVTGIYRDTAKAPADFTENARFTATRGDLSKDTVLDIADTDALFYVPPPVYDGTNTADFAEAAANKIKDALSRASVKRLVVLSALGAQFENIGILKLNSITDQKLADAAPEVIIAQAGWFMENWGTALETIKGDEPFVESTMTPIASPIAMISTTDVGTIASRLLLETGQPLSSRPQVYELHGLRLYSPNDVGLSLEKLAGKSVKVVGIEPDKLLPYYAAQVPPPYDQEIVDMILAINGGGRIAELMQHGGAIIRGEVDLVEALRKVLTEESKK